MLEDADAACAVSGVHGEQRAAMRASCVLLAVCATRVVSCDLILPQRHALFSNSVSLAKASRTGSQE